MNKIKDLTWTRHVYDSKSFISGPDIQYYAESGDGIHFFSVLDRETGYGYGIRDVETAFKSHPCDRRLFILRSGMFDIRDYPELTIDEAVALMKDNAS